MTDLSKLKGMAQWPKIRQETEKAVLDVLGHPPRERAELQLLSTEEESFNGYSRRKVEYFVDEWVRATAWLFLPEGDDLAPGLVVCHDRTPAGKDEPAGLRGDRTLALAEYYAQRGYATIAADSIAAGERRSVGLEAFDTSNFYKDYPGQSALGKMVWDYSHAVDVLMDLRDVDHERIGVIGHGLGGTTALLLAAFDERIRACVSSCGFTRFHDDPGVARWVLDHDLALLPRLADAVASGIYPFDWEHVLALAAPIPVLLLTALDDPDAAAPESCAKAVKTAAKVYKLLGEPRALENIEHREGRALTPGLLDQADDWFEQWL
jgi:dienelactone hydrolase